MPELPEVHTTASILNRLLPGLSIRNIWTDYGGEYHKGKAHIKDVIFFKKFRKAFVGKKIERVGRLGKNVLIFVSGGLTIIIHMKMTGHLLFGRYKFNRSLWKADEIGPLEDPYNRFIHFVMSLSNGKHLALSDMRKFAKVTFAQAELLEKSPDLSHLGPDPTSRSFSFDDFQKRILMKPLGKIKQVLMDQSVIAGVGNIYSDEILYASNIHPNSIVKKIPIDKLRDMYKTMKLILKKGIQFGGDSMSDYRNPYGKPGKFQLHHQAYRQAGLPCKKTGCGGIINRIVVGGRSAHFCPTHQKTYK